MTTEHKPQNSLDELGAGDVQGASAQSPTGQSPSNQHSTQELASEREYAVHIRFLDPGRDYEKTAVLRVWAKDPWVARTRARHNFIADAKPLGQRFLRVDGTFRV